MAARLILAMAYCICSTSTAFAIADGQYPWAALGASGCLFIAAVVASGEA